MEEERIEEDDGQQEADGRRKREGGLNGERRMDEEDEGE